MLKWIDDHLEESIMAVLLAGITIVFTYSIIMRYLLNNAPSWAEEISRFMFIWSAFLSIGLCIKRQSSIRIDMLLMALSEKAKGTLLLFVNIFIIVVLAYWLNGAVKVVKTLMNNGQTSPALLIPMWTVYGSSVVGFILGIIRSIQQIIRDVAMIKGR